MATIFFISDLHLGHANILGFKKPNGEPLRVGTDGWEFANIEEHDDFIIANINATVRPADRLILVGDCVMNKRYLHKLSRINGKKTLVMGNHDPQDITLYAGLVDKIAGALPISDYIVTHIPVHERQVAERFAANIHGHLHGHPVLTRFDTVDRRYFNVSVESLNYTPISLEEINKSLIPR